MDKGSGRCLCGAVRYRFGGEPLWQSHCHCESCRRATASGFTSFLSVPSARLDWTGKLRTFRSSPGVTRRFCPVCGTQMSYETAERPGETDLYAATLDDPHGYSPVLHDHWAEHLPWISPGDGLPRPGAPRRMAPDEDFAPVLALIRSAFAAMEGRIDPPSSAGRLTVADLARSATVGEVWAVEDRSEPVACMMLEFSQNRVYLSKLAVARPLRRQGIARTLVRIAARRAAEHGLPVVELQTRTELTENHRTFEALGFRRAGESAHPGYDRTTTLLYRLAVPAP